MDSPALHTHIYEIRTFIVITSSMDFHKQWSSSTEKLSINHKGKGKEDVALSQGILEKNTINNMHLNRSCSVYSVNMFLHYWKEGRKEGKKNLPTPILIFIKLVVIMERMKDHVRRTATTKIYFKKPFFLVGSGG